MHSKYTSHTKIFKYLVVKVKEIFIYDVPNVYLSLNDIFFSQN